LQPASDVPGVGARGVRLGVVAALSLSARRGPGLWQSADKRHSALPPCGKIHVEMSQGISDLACHHRDGDLRHYGRAALHVRIVPSVRGGVTRQERRRCGRRWLAARDASPALTQPRPYQGCSDRRAWALSAELNLHSSQPPSAEGPEPSIAPIVAVAAVALVACGM
jgi:hypothetical protein